MLIDWFTVVAQLINFLILIYLLKRFLYRPILKAIDAREARIANEMDDARKKQQQAELEHHKYQDLNDQLQKHKSDLLAKAQDEAKNEKERMMQEAKDTYQHLQDRFKQSLQNEEQQIHEALKNKVGSEVINTLRKALADLADQSLEDSITSVFIKKFDTLKESELTKLKSTIDSEGKEVSVQSTYPLSTEQQKNLKDAISKKIRENISIHFKTVSEELPGIVLLAGGYKIAWTASDYLHSLQTQLNNSQASDKRINSDAAKTNKKVLDVGQIH